MSLTSPDLTACREKWYRFSICSVWGWTTSFFAINESLWGNTLAKLLPIFNHRIHQRSDKEWLSQTHYLLSLLLEIKQVHLDSCWSKRMQAKGSWRQAQGSGSTLASKGWSRGLNRLLQHEFSCTYLIFSRLLRLDHSLKFLQYRSQPLTLSSSIISEEKNLSILKRALSHQSVFERSIMWDLWEFAYRFEFHQGTKGPIDSKPWRKFL